MSSRRKVKTNSGDGLLNTLINRLPVELHLPGYQYCGPGTNLKKRLSQGQRGINGLDFSCRNHDIAYEHSNSLFDRGKADRELETRAWERVGARDTDLGEKAAAWLVASSMKVKRKIGAGCRFKNIIGVAKKAIKKTMKTCRPVGSSNMSRLIKSAIVAVKKHVRKNKGNNKPRVIRIQKTGGVLPLMPIIAGLSALGTLVGGVDNVVKTIRDIKSNNGSSIHLGKGLFLHPYKGGGSYKIVNSKGMTALRTKNKKKNMKIKSKN